MSPDEQRFELTAGLVAKKLDFDKMQLVYLERCIMEALRLDPPLTISAIHETIAEVKLENGSRISKGTLFTFNFTAIHRNVD